MATPSSSSSSGKPEQLKPGDEAQPGAAGTGEDLCEECGGRGKRADGSPCPNCQGTGRVVRGIGGG